MPSAGQIGGAIAGATAGGLLAGPGGAAQGAALGGALGGNVGGTLGGMFRGIGRPAIGNRYRAGGYDVDPNAYRDPNLEANRQRYADAIAAAQGRQAPQMASAQDFRQGQLGLMQQLQAQAAGQGPSMAQDQLRQATDRNMAQAAALQASQRGGNAGLAARQVQQQRGQMGQEAAGQSALLRSQEMLQARGELAGLTGAARGQDIGEAGANLQAQMQTQQQQDQMQQYYESLGFSAEQAQLQAQQALEQLRVQEALGQQGINAGLAQSRYQLGGQLAGGGAGALGGILQGGAALAASDERVKENVGSGDEEVYRFLDALNAKHYDYKDPGAPGAAPGRQVGIMAQDLERSPMGAPSVVEAGGTKMVTDGPRGYASVLAAAANLHKRLKSLEGR